MKIIRVDNYDREGLGYDPQLVCDGLDAHWGPIVLEALIDHERDPATYYRLVHDQYVVTKWEP